MLIASLILALQSAPAPAALSLEQQTAIRCSAAFAILAEGQARGDPRMAPYPVLGTRGREFFVVSSARIMDETGRSRGQVAQVLQTEARSLREEGALEATMPACLLLLDTSGL
ncbi:hypothetical protein [Erythrobacter litoralis]|uniref:Uncharacterized protein n=1 Tax=Erythrobacter litoralis (strain HTCC2594) TaxID=314225 RepID=Q2N7H6_ERYLH|nr:hypothetical protein [Erythrobacter litoralis]ABC64365.1 hypothetical protein ELI_11365 [Erythrobacter litoralis HTCC2594]